MPAIIGAALSKNGAKPCDSGLTVKLIVMTTAEPAMSASRQPRR